MTELYFVTVFVSYSSVAGFFAKYVKSCLGLLLVFAKIQKDSQTPFTKRSG